MRHETFVTVQTSDNVNVELKLGFQTKLLKIAQERVRRLGKWNGQSKRRWELRECWNVV